MTRYISLGEYFWLAETDRKFQGNPTRSYRTREPVRIVGELADWLGHSPEKLKAMRERLDELKRTDSENIDD